MSVYTVRSISDGWRVTKFDGDLNVESSYAVHGTLCECPQASRGYCRHIEILGIFQAASRIDTGWFLDYDKGGEWLPPLKTGEPTSAPVPGELKARPASSPGFQFQGVEGIRRI